MTPEHLALLTEIARVHAGLALGEPSSFHLETRLGALARREGAPTVEALVERLKAPGADVLARATAEALAQPDTCFFRDREVFDALRTRLLISHFERVDDNWRASPRLRQSVRWGRVNLSTDLSRAGPFDLILCRNVLSSFEQAACARTLQALVAALGPDGVLMLGAKEAALAPDGFDALREAPGLYRRKGSRAKAA